MHDDMSLEQYKDSPHYQKIYQQIETLGLVEHMKHLDEYGYTVIPPELVAPKSFLDRLRKAVLAVNEQRTGQKINLADIEEQQPKPVPFAYETHQPFDLSDELKPWTYPN